MDDHGNDGVRLRQCLAPSLQGWRACDDDVPLVCAAAGCHFGEHLRLSYVVIL